MHTGILYGFMVFNATFNNVSVISWRYIYHILYNIIYVDVTIIILHIWHLSSHSVVFLFFNFLIIFLPSSIRSMKKKFQEKWLRNRFFVSLLINRSIDLIDCCLKQNVHHFSYTLKNKSYTCNCKWRREQVNLQWDDDEVRFFLDQHAELDFYIASSFNQQSAGRHVTPLRHIILIPNQSICSYYLKLRA